MNPTTKAQIQAPFTHELHSDAGIVGQHNRSDTILIRPNVAAIVNWLFEYLTKAIIRDSTTELTVAFS